jgi:hypothetical protein
LPFSFNTDLFLARYGFSRLGRALGAAGWPTFFKKKKVISWIKVIGTTNVTAFLWRNDTQA